MKGIISHKKVIQEDKKIKSIIEFEFITNGVFLQAERIPFHSFLFITLLLL